MSSSSRPTPEQILTLAKALVDKGLLVEAGWMGFRLGAMHPDAPADQVSEMRLAFFAGAQHLFTSMMTMLDPDAEPTEQDMERMTQISKELERFTADVLEPRFKQ